jgi:hypothetical protein
MNPHEPVQGDAVEVSNPQLERELKQEPGTDQAFVKPEDGASRRDLYSLPKATPAQSKKPPPSLRKIEANRTNALKSTGPLTAAGKSRVSRNAVKHGIFSKHLLINDPQGGEHAHEYCQLHNAIREHYQPEGLLEELWIDKIAAWTWRLGRVIRCETGQIDRALASHRSDVAAEKGTHRRFGGAGVT